MYDEANLTSNQMWNQNVLNIFSKMEESGYIVNPDWFLENEWFKTFLSFNTNSFI